MISMSSLFDDLKEGLEEAIAYESGNDSKCICCLYGSITKTMEAWKGGRNDWLHSISSCEKLVLLNDKKDKHRQLPVLDFVFRLLFDNIID